MRQKRDILGELGQRLDIPREALPGGFGVVLSGRGEVRVYGCQRILSYAECKISLSLSGGLVLHIEGAGLLCSDFQSGLIGITGKIITLHFAEGEE